MSRSDAAGRAAAIGIMSGTSADGVDAVITRIDRSGVQRRSELLAMASRPYSDTLRRRVLGAQEGTLPLRDLFAIHVEVAEIAAAVAQAILETPGAQGILPVVAGYHGQTVFHDPRGERSGRRVTVQIGASDVLAAALPCPVVSQFRMADIVAGGEGAPLVPRFDYHQFASESRDRVLLNLGGIANLTRIPAGAAFSEITAFDCGPGNMLLDGIVAAFAPPGTRFDEGGAISSRGRVAEDVVRDFLSEPYFSRRPPKSAGREEFGAGYLARFLARTDALSVEDRLRTAAALTAAAVAKGIEMSGKGQPQELYVSGGGARNMVLLDEIRTRIHGTTVATSDAIGVPVQAKEAMAFAFLAFETISGRPGNAPSATGARHEVILGSITPPPIPRR